MKTLIKILKICGFVAFIGLTYFFAKRDQIEAKSNPIENDTISTEIKSSKFTDCYVNFEKQVNYYLGDIDKILSENGFKTSKDFNHKKDFISYLEKNSKEIIPIYTLNHTELREQYNNLLKYSTCQIPEYLINLYNFTIEIENGIYSSVPDFEEFKERIYTEPQG